MRTSRLTIAVALAGLEAAAPAGASRSFKGNVCGSSPPDSSPRSRAYPRIARRLVR